MIFILGGVALFTFQLARFSRVWANLPSGLTIAGIPVGQLDRQQASQRLLEAYSIPIELRYGDAVIQMSPTVVGFTLDLESMLAAAEQERTRTPFWESFWNFLWGRGTVQTDIPLVVNYSEERLRDYLINQVAPRYDRPPSPATPVVGTVSFRQGEPGTALEVDRSVVLIDAALKSINQRVVELPVRRTSPSRPAFQNLEVLLRQTLDLAGYDGLAGVYLHDLQTSQEINFLYQSGEILPNQPEMAFTASSTIKIPIMVSVFRRVPEPAETKIVDNLRDMIGQSRNESSDWLMQNAIDLPRGPLLVTEDIQALGLQNTFLAGYFFRGAPLLKLYQTAANQRPDLITNPDPYSQTTPAEIGTLLVDIYTCAERGGGSLIAVFPGEITPAECQRMVEFLKGDHLPSLITAGLPEGTPIAHKHGWVTDNFYVIHDMSDAAIVYTPGGSYVLVIFLYHPVQLVWDPASQLVADLSRAVYNFYNLPSQ